MDNVFITRSAIVAGSLKLDSLLLQGDLLGLDNSQCNYIRKQFKDQVFTPSLSSNSHNVSPSCSDLQVADEPHSYNSTFRTETPFQPSQAEFKKPLLYLNTNMKGILTEEEKAKRLGKYDLELIIKTLLLCHNTKTELNEKHNSYIHDTNSKVHETVLAFCRQVGMEFAGCLRLSDAKTNSYKLHLGEQFIYFSILAINEETPTRNRYSIVLTESRPTEDPEHYTLLVCGYEIDSMLTCLALNNADRETLKADLTELKEKGLQSLIYAKRNIRKSEFTTFQQAKDMESENLIQIEKLYDSLEKDLEVVVVVNYKEALRENAFENLEALKDSQVKFFLLSKDSEATTIAMAYNAKIIDKNTNVKKIVSPDNKSTVILMKHFLSTMKREHESISMENSVNKLQRTVSVDSSNAFKYSKMPKPFTLVMDGNTMEIVLKNAFLKENFKFILIYTQNLICYQISSECKLNLVRFVKQAAVSNLSQTLAIGSCAEDLRMFSEADVAIEASKSEPTGAQTAWDIVLKDIENLAHLVLVQGPLGFKKMETIVINYLFVFELMLLLRFFFEFMSSLSLSQLFSDQLFHFNGLILAIISVVYFCWGPNSRNNDLLKTFPVIYRSNALKKRYSFLKITLIALVPSVLVTICFLGVTILYSNDLSQGTARSFLDVETQLFYCVVFVTYLTVISLIFY